MTTVKIISDLHLEHRAGSNWEFDKLKSVFPEEERDILVLAGDIQEHAHWSGEKYFIDLMDSQLLLGDIVYVPGNHEYYHGSIEATTTLIRQYEKELNARSEARFSLNRFHFLNGEIKEIKGVTFFGGTLWTDIDGADWYKKKMIGEYMSDFSVISMWNDVKKRPTRFTPQDAIDIHTKHRDTLTSLLYSEEHENKNIFVVTHHAPSFHSCSFGDYANHYANCGYASNLDNFILGAPNKPKYWAHGHIHNSIDYQIDTCRVVANPCGYPYGGEGQNSKYNKEFFVSI